MTTKERIITGAIQLFNADGIAHVTTRKVAAAVEISHGNLTYHFPNKAALLESAYEGIAGYLRSEINPKGRCTLQHLDRLMHGFAKVRAEYSFCFTDTMEIRRHYPEVADKHAEIMTERLRETRKLLSYYAEIGLIKPAKDPKHFDYLVHAMWFINGFWLGQQSIIDPDRNEAGSQYAVDMIWSLIIPHLSQKGLVEYYFLRNISH
jgi:AcrR family transcriptional regulator